MKTKKYSKTGKPAQVVNEPAIAYSKPEFTLSAHSILDVDPDQVSEPLKRVDTFRRGLRKNSLEKLKDMTGLDNNTLAAALGMSSKTLQRKQVFDVIQSEKMYELAELYALGIDYFGEEGFSRWMGRPLFSIGNRRPVELIDVSEGMALLKTEIMRLQHGIAI
jgi:putative toxin-antitoxin system antitoxin component (TIGR02293 family)